MATYHRDLTGADIHEPKGADTASAGTVYVADGAGSGSWQQPFSRSLEAHFGSNVAQAISIDSLNPTYLTIDGLDARTDTSGVFSGSPIWDSSVNSLILSNQSLTNGRVFYVSVGFSIDPSDSTDTTVRLVLEFNHGSGNEVIFEMERILVPKGIEKAYNTSKLIFLDNTIDTNAEVKLAMNCNAVGSTVLKKSIIIQTV